MYAYWSVSSNDDTYLHSPLKQALFAGSIPEIIDIVKTFPKYNGTYVNYRGRRHVTKPTNMIRIRLGSMRPK